MFLMIMFAHLIRTTSFTKTDIDIRDEAAFRYTNLRGNNLDNENNEKVLNLRQNILDVIDESNRLVKVIDDVFNAQFLKSVFFNY